MPPPQAWASRQFTDCPSEGKSRAVQCKFCVDKKVAYNSTSRKASHLKQCVSFAEHVARLVEQENESGFLNRELEQVPNFVLDHVLEQTGARRVMASQSQGQAQGQVHDHDGGVSALFAASSVRAGLAQAGLGERLEGSRVGPLRTETPRANASTSTPTTAARSSAYNRSVVDRALTNAAHDQGVTPTSYNASSHPVMADALRLLDRETRVRIARELLDEAYEDVKRAVDNYIEKQHYLNTIVDDGDLPAIDRPGIPH